MYTIEKFYLILTRLTAAQQFCVAYSGGLDSQVLLHSLIKLNQQLHDPYKIRAIHIHHGLSPNADAWAEHCLHNCKLLNITCEVYKAQVILDNKSPEDAARSARYAALKKLLHADEILLTAHTQDDQAETLLLQLMRGAGPKGLSAMPEIINFANSSLLRPLLTFTREQLHVYAQAHALTWIDDESNNDLRFDRNYLRHTILPLLKQRWPKAIANIARSAKYCAEINTLADEMASNDLAYVKDKDADTLNVKRLRELNEEHQRNVIRFWLQRLNLPLPSSVKLKQLLQDVLHSRYDATPRVHWQGVEIRRYQNHIYAMPPLIKHDASLIIPWDLQHDLALPNDLGLIKVSAIKDMGMSINDINNLTVRFRRSGERCRPQGSKYTHSLKKLLQQWNVPPWQRDRIPLLYQNDNLIAVIGYCICDS